MNEKHDCNDFTINYINVNCANNMQNPKLGDANIAMSTTYCNDHDWGDNDSYDLENLFMSHYGYAIDNNFCNSTESGLGEVMTLFDDNPTILEECQLCMHMDHEENILFDSYIVEFDYDPTGNYYERGKYGCRNLHVTKLPLFMLRLLFFLLFPCIWYILLVLLICLLMECLCIGSMLDIFFFTCYMMLSLCFNYHLSCEHHWNFMPS